MCVLLFDFFSKATIEKNWRSQNLSENYISRKENLKKCNSFEKQKGTQYIRENFTLELVSSAVFRLQKCVSDFF